MINKKTIFWCLAGVISLGFLNNQELFARDGFGYTFESRLYKNMIDGSTEQAVLKDGFFNEENFTIEYNRSKETSPVEIRSAVNLRLTNDRQASGKDFELRNYYFMLSGGAGGNFDLSLGNIYTQFSRYALNRNIEGIAGRIKFGKTSVIPVWGQTQKAENDRTYQRLAYGIRLENSPNSKSRIGFSYLTTADNPNSVSLDTTTFRREENSIMALDGSVAFGAWQLEGEAASSGYDEKNTSRSEKGIAYRLKAMYRKSNFRGEAEYEVADSSFNTLSGWAIKDRAVAKTRLGYTFSEKIAGEISYELSKNNVSGYLPFGESAASPAVMINFALPKNRMDAYLSTRMRNVISDDNPRTTERGVFTVASGLGLRLWGFLRPSFSVENNFNTDSKTPANDTRSTFYEASLKAMLGKNSGGGLDFAPMITYRVNEDYVSATGLTDFNKSVITRFSAQTEKYWEFGGNFTTSWSDRPNSGSSASRILWSADATARIKGSNDKTLTLAYSVNNNETRNPASGISKYTESVLETRLRLKF